MPKTAKNKKIPQTISVVLPDIRSAHNVGSVFRTADAAGVSHIYLAGHTPCPVDRFGRVQKEIAKTALGAEQVIPWTYVPTVAPLLRKLKKQGSTLVAIEQAKNSVDYRKMPKTGDIVLIFGNEVDGVSASVLKAVDCVAEIPMRGTKESLNVAVTAGIILFEMIR